MKDTERQTQTNESKRNQSRPLSRRFFLRGTASSAGLAVGIGSSLSGRVSSFPQSNPTPRLHVDGNRLKNPDGEKVILRGVCTADPKAINDTSDSRGKTIEQVIALATNNEKGWYSNVIHLPLEPTFIGESQEEYPEPVAFSQAELNQYLQNHLDPAVQKCKQEGVYCVIDYHRHKFRGFAEPALDEEIRMFWETIAPRYADQPHVLFELYNEPVLPTDEEISWPLESSKKKDIWLQWQEVAQPWVNLIREHASETVILIGSPFWSVYPQGAILHKEFKGENLAYTVTVYPGHPPGEVSEYDSWLANVWEEVPLFVSEWGYQPEAEDEHVQGTTEGFGQTMRDWLSNRPIHWTAWCFDPIWWPVMFERDSDRPSNWKLLGGDYQGEFIQDFLTSYSSQNDS